MERFGTFPYFGSFALSDEGCCGVLAVGEVLGIPEWRGWWNFHIRRQLPRNVVEPWGFTYCWGGSCELDVEVGALSWTRFLFYRYRILRSVLWCCQVFHFECSWVFLAPFDGTYKYVEINNYKSMLMFFFFVFEFQFKSTKNYNSSNTPKNWSTLKTNYAIDDNV